MSEDALTDLFNAVRLLTDTMSRVVARLDDPEIALFWLTEWDRVIKVTEERTKNG